MQQTLQVSLARTNSARRPRSCGPKRVVVSAASAGPSSGPRILVTGATGGTGRVLVEKLEGMSPNVAALTRNATKARSLLPSGLEVLEGDLFDYDAARKAVEGRDVVFICSGTTNRLDPFDPVKADWQGVNNIVAAAKQAGVRKVVLVSSIGVDDPFFPLNLPLIGNGVLWMKKLGELELQRSGLDYTIIRPGGLRSDDGKSGNVVAGKPNTFGLPPRPKLPGGIRRTTVADACIAAWELENEARNKIIEIVEEENAPYKTWSELFSSV